MMSAELSNVRSITPEQVRQARKLLGYSRYRLGQLSNVTESFIYVFEKTGRVATILWRPRDFDGLASIRASLEAAGVEFIEENGSGPGVRMRR